MVKRITFEMVKTPASTRIPPRKAPRPRTSRTPVASLSTHSRSYWISRTPGTVADSSKLKLPVIDDPVFGYRRVNVAAAESDPDSLLNWLRGMIQIRRQHPVFGDGKLTLLAPPDKHILAYLRENAAEKVLAVVNLSGEPQDVNLSSLIGPAARLTNLIDGDGVPARSPLKLEP